MKFKKLLAVSMVVASMLVMSQSAFANEASKCNNFLKIYNMCFACECDVTYWIKDGDSFNPDIKITRNGILKKIEGEGFFTTIEKGSKKYQETIKKLKDLDKNFESEFGNLSL